MDYCDTNIITAFVNEPNLKKVFGINRSKSFNEIKGWRDTNAEKLSVLNKKCVISRPALFEDIKEHNAPAGAVLTYRGLNEIDFKEVDGIEEGKKIYNLTCSKIDRTSRFHEKFCENGKLKKDLNKSSMTDVRHFGSAIKLGAKRFITANRRDFRPLQNFTKIKIITESRRAIAP